jgi:hypothetical protein
MLAMSKAFGLAEEVRMPWCNNLLTGARIPAFLRHVEIKHSGILLAFATKASTVERRWSWRKLGVFSLNVAEAPFVIKLQASPRNSDILLHLPYTSYLLELQLHIMNSIKSLTARAARTTVYANCIRSTIPFRLLSTHSLNQTRSIRPSSGPLAPSIVPYTHQSRTYASKSSADEIIEQIQDQYATARDEFEIATEETEKKTVYAADDRAAAREELDALKELYDLALQGSDGEEVKSRIGQRIRELDSAVQALEQRAMED